MKNKISAVVVAKKTLKKVNGVNRIKKVLSSKSTNGTAVKKEKAINETIPTIQIHYRRMDRMKVKIQGITPLITHKFSPGTIKALDNRDRNKTTARKAREPEEEMRDSLYPVEGQKSLDPLSKKTAERKRATSGMYGIPGMAIKKAAVSAARYSGDKKALNMTNSKGLFSVETPVIPIHCKKITMGADMARIGSGLSKVPQIRYRPYFWDWSCEFWVRFSPDLISAESILNLINMAGTHVGIGDWRVECNGDKGMFEVVPVNKKK